MTQIQLVWEILSVVNLVLVIIVWEEFSLISDLNRTFIENGNQEGKRDESFGNVQSNIKSKQ